jgi:electron transfer flavoprotein alpha subunit
MPFGILVWSERTALALELLAEARHLADMRGGEVTLCTGGEVSSGELESYAAHGADVVYLADNPATDAAQWAGLLTTVAAASRPGLILTGATKTGMEVAPRVAERCQAGYAAWAIEIDVDPATGLTTAACMLYAGAGLARYDFSRPLTVLSVAPGTFAPQKQQGRTARVETVVLENELTQLTIVGERPKSSAGARMQEARAIVDIGRGVKDLEGLEMVRALAKLLDAQLGCSRPVSSDRDWLPEWLGLSGAKVRPELCLTIGISGAIQHVVGIRDSRVIAAVNSDENAAIFTQADVGAVADLNEFVPVLIERLGARGVQPGWH